MTEITDEQRDAVNWLRQVVGGTSDFAAERAITILNALPSELTNPQPVLPTKPGSKVRISGTGLHGRGLPWGPYDCLLLDSGDWVDMNDGQTITNPHDGTWEPIYERPQISRDKALSAYEDATGGYGYVAGVDAILALVNGADQ